MRRLTLVLLAMVLCVIPAFATGTGETEASENMIAPQDSSSDDAVLREGLPAVPDNEVTLELITSYSGDGEQYVDTYISDIVQKWYPNISIEYEAGGSSELAQIVNTRIAGGTPPDLVMASSSYYMADWVKAGAIRPMDQYWDKYGLDEIVPGGLRNTFLFDGNLYGIPLGSGQNNIFYWNANVLNDAGVELPPYDTWDKALEVAEQFKQNSDKPFYVEGYSPAWFGMAKTLALGASRFGVELYERILNGDATEQDFRNILEFHKSLVETAGNEDFVSTNGIAGVMEVAGRGDGATAFGGTWGYPRFADVGLELGKEWGMGSLPGEKTFLFVPVGFMVMEGSGNETFAEAVATTAILKSTQYELNAGKGNVPARTDIDPDLFPEVGRYIAARASTAAFAESVAIPRAVAGIPPIVHQEWPAPFSGFMSGSMSLSDAVDQIMRIQARHQDQYVIEWEY